MEESRTFGTRARTGCLECRRRKKKCDEGKPICRNCRARDRNCQYSPLTFITKSTSNGGPVSESRPTRYKGIKFVHGHARHDPSEVKPPSAAVEDAPIEEWDGEVNHEASDESDIEPLVYVASPVSNTTAWRNVSYQHIDSPMSTLRGPLAGTPMSQPTDSLTGETPTAHLNTTKKQDIPHTPPTQVSFSETAYKLLESADPPISEKDPETLLICHFRYILAPIIDGGDIKGPFGIQAIVFAKHRRAVTAALMAASAYHRATISLKTKSEDLANHERFCQEAEANLVGQDSAGQLFGRMLLELPRIWRQGPGSWARYISETTADFDAWTSLPSDQACWEPFGWFRLRTDLAAALWDKRAPMTALDQRVHGIVISNPNIHGFSPRQRCHSILALLHKVLTLVHGDATHSLSNSPDDITDPSRGLPSVWLALWDDCQTWYNLRPATMRPVASVSTMEACRLDPAALGAFPIYVYTNSLSVLANVAYHISALLLVLHKPFRLEVSAVPERALTENWHIQSIVGTARRNDFPEQWEPVMCSGLLFVAKWMTHRSQQTTLLSCLQKCSAIAGFELRDEVLEIQEEWKTPRTGH